MYIRFFRLDLFLLPFHSPMPPLIPIEMVPPMYSFPMVQQYPCALSILGFAPPYNTACVAEETAVETISPLVSEPNPSTLSAFRNETSSSSQENLIGQDDVSSGISQMDTITDLVVKLNIPSIPIESSCANDVHIASNGCNKIKLRGNLVRDASELPEAEAPTDPCNLYVKGLDPEVIRNDEDLRNEFTSYGQLISARLATYPKGLSKGFGFLAFSNGEEALRAKESCHGKVIGSKEIYVAFAEPKGQRTARLKEFFSQENGTNLRVESVIVRHTVKNNRGHPFPSNWPKGK